MKLKVFICFFLALTSLFFLFSCNTVDPPALHSVVFDSNGGNEIGSFSVHSGALVSEPQDPVRDGYEFMGWYNGETKWNFSTDKATADLTLTAKWKQYFTVTFDTGLEIEKTSVKVLDGDTANKPKQDPTKAGSRFLGWFIGEEEWNFSTPITENTVITAKWIELYNVKFDTDGAKNLSTYTAVLDKGALATAPEVIPQKDGYRFLGWFIGEEEYDFSTPITESLEIKAAWIEVYTVTLDPDGAENIQGYTTVLDKNSLVFDPVDLPEKEGHRFLGWFVGTTEWNFNTPITEDTVIKAMWIEIFTVTFIPAGAENLQEYSITLDKGSKIPAPEIIPEKEQYVFLGWHFEDNLWIFESETINSDMTLHAQWQALKDIPGYCEIIFDTAGGIAAEGTKNTVLKGGSKITAPADPIREGFKFAGWLVNGEPWNFEYDLVTDDTVLVAKWIKIFTVNVIMDAQPYIDAFTVLDGDLIESPAEPKKDGFKFIGWFDENGKMWNFDSDTVSADLTLTAEWVVAFTVSFNTNGADEIPEELVAINDTVKIPAIPNRQGYKFIGWFVGEEEWDFDTPITEDIEIEAIWVAVYTVTVNYSGAPDYENYTLTVEHGYKITKPEEPTYYGRIFMGWYIEGSAGEEQFDFDTQISCDLNIVAKWVIDTEGDGTIGSGGTIITPPDDFSKNND